MNPTYLILLLVSVSSLNLRSQDTASLTAKSTQDAAAIKAILEDDSSLRSHAQDLLEEYDLDVSGDLSLTELNSLIDDMFVADGLQAPGMDFAEEGMTELDVNGDGKLSVDEFKVFYREALEGELTKEE